MSQDDVKSIRNWKEVAPPVAKEDNPTRMMELAKELIRLLDAESNKRFDQVAPEKAHEHGAA
jgi:hypothetical protein